MVRLGQNFLADTNLLEAIVDHAALSHQDVVLEVGAGEGILSRRLAERCAHLHIVELDRGLEEHLIDLAEREDVTIHWADAMKADLAAFDPPPNRVIANLPYSIATPLLIRTVTELPALERWVVMVQAEIAERLAAAAGTKAYGAPSVVIQWACRVRLLRRVDRAVFKPRPRVDSALIEMVRTGPAPDAFAHRFIRDAFSHRRKSLARSVELARPGSIDMLRAALAEVGLDLGVRAEAVPVDDFRRLAVAYASTLK